VMADDVPYATNEFKNSHDEIVGFAAGAAAPHPNTEVSERLSQDRRRAGRPWGFRRALSRALCSTHSRYARRAR
jgi:hypothetical protein